MPAAKSYNKMKIITVNIPKHYLKYIDYLIREIGIAPSRSEFIRWSIGNQINRDLKQLEKMEEMMDKVKNLRSKLKKDGVFDTYDKLKYVRIPGRKNGEEFVKIIKRLEY